MSLMGFWTEKRVVSFIIKRLYAFGWHALDLTSRVFTYVACIIIAISAYMVINISACIIVNTKAAHRNLRDAMGV